MEVSNLLPGLCEMLVQRFPRRVPGAKRSVGHYIGNLIVLAAATLIILAPIGVVVGLMALVVSALSITVTDPVALPVRQIAFFAGAVVISIIMAVGVYRIMGKAALRQANEVLATAQQMSRNANELYDQSVRDERVLYARIARFENDLRQTKKEHRADLAHWRRTIDEANARLGQIEADKPGWNSS